MILECKELLKYQSCQHTEAYKEVKPRLSPPISFPLTQTGIASLFPPPEACGQLLPEKSISALHDTVFSHSNIFYFFLRELIYISLSLKEAKQLRALCVKCHYYLIYLAFSCFSVQIKCRWFRSIFLLIIWKKIKVLKLVLILLVSLHQLAPILHDCVWDTAVSQSHI